MRVCQGKIKCGLLLLIGFLVLAISSCRNETNNNGPVLKSWGIPQSIDIAQGMAMVPQVAVSTNGEAVVVWDKVNGGESHIWVNNYTPDLGWGESSRIDTEAGYASFPQVGMNANGAAHVVWMQHDGTVFNAWANIYVPRLGWTWAFIIDDGPEDVYEPQVSVSQRGDALAIWWQGGRKSIYSSRFSVDAFSAWFAWGWLPAELVEFDETDDARYPEILFDEEGKNGFAVWRQSDGTRYNIWANRYNDLSGWGIPEMIETNDSGSALQPQIAWAPTWAPTSIIAVWHQYESGVSSIWANRFESGSGWETEQLLEVDDSGGAFGPQISMDPDGNGVAVWSQSDGTVSNIWANRYIIGSGWSGPELLETDNSGHAFAPQVGVDPFGGAWVVWSQSDGRRTNIWGNHLNPNSGWSGPELLETDDAGDARSPQIAFDKEGNAIAVWVQSDGSNFKVMANHYQ